MGSDSQRSQTNLLDSLQNLEASYNRAKVGLLPVFEYASSFVDSHGHESASFSALPLPSPLSDDYWCIDPRGTLTLQVAKDTYETLGLVGSKLPFKFREAPEQYIIRIPLRKQLETPKNWERYKGALKAWDQRREENAGGWDILFSCSVGGFQPPFPHSTPNAKPQVTRRTQVHIPRPSITPCPLKGEDAKDDWEEGMSEIFEWVGLVSLANGGSRLAANDRVDPFVAIYSPPDPSYVGNVVHLQWTGFLSPEFIQSVINFLVEHRPPLSSVTSHCPYNSPVCYLPAPPKAPPIRVVTEDAECTWSLILENAEGRESRGVPEDPETGVREATWAMAETASKWDMRWG
ncbi:hypothetical protein GLOTRDRAFT_128220 [Gloeophyllum trabeum ATCC 11539]|uniref:Uncharacterized protein n=1 Tax=Gloeophyllum trabeum (strain ATCC 11539 / FP-39264 / Madison 617) TaxID=670483 RepID=S7Q8G5_GLOTA|nr:uncharacterized protein GLOTRDRAFT_128220 [Gloeophyllum trabeum ATCC 11539]EPQ56271.1 hypothetical protein GLOTRDRAFT_128220 [Gloeophyllum trabeum ATCC 11539]